MKLLLKFAVAGALVAGSTVAQAADKLTFYCSAQEDWCQLMTKEVSKTPPFSSLTNSFKALIV